MDAKQQALTLLLLKLFEPFVFYNVRTTQKVHDHCNNHRHHTIFLAVAVSQTNQEQTTKNKSHPSLPDHTFFES